jgi:hypothetical protein
MLSTIWQRKCLLELASKRITEEAESGNMGGYQIACSVNNLVNATGKLQERKLDLIERLTLVQEEGEKKKPATSYDPDNVDFEIESEAERLTYELVKREVDRKKTEAARIGSLAVAGE